MEIEKLLENMRYCCGDMGYDDECSDHCIDPRDNRENEEEPRFCRQWLIRDAANVIEELQNQLAAVTAERDAAMNDLNAIGKGDEICLYCIHNLDGGDNAEKCRKVDFECNKCDATCGCRSCQYNSNWEWRGKGENNGI